MRTRAIRKAVDPLWDPREEFEFLCEEGKKPHKLKGFVWDSGESSLKDPIVVGSFELDLSTVSTCSHAQLTLIRTQCTNLQQIMH